MYPAVRLVEVKAAEGPGEFILVHEAVSSPVLLAVALLIPILLVAAAALRILSQRRAVTGIGTRYSISMGEDQGKGVSTVATASVAEGFEPLKPLHAGNGDNRGLEVRHSSLADLIFMSAPINVSTHTHVLFLSLSPPRFVVVCFSTRSWTVERSSYISRSKLSDHG